MERNKLYILIASLAGCALVYGVLQLAAPSAEEPEEEHEHEEFIHLSPEAAASFGVTVIQASETPLQMRIQVPGRIDFNPDKVAHVVPKAPGIAKTIYSRIGEPVEQNSIMALIESQQAAEAKAAYLAAIQREQLAANTLLREQNLHDNKISASQDYFDAQNRAAETLIELQLAKQKLESFGFSRDEIFSLSKEKEPNLRALEIRAPIAGTVIQRHLTPGEVVSEGHEAFIVADLKDVIASLSVFPKDVSQMKPGLPVELTHPSGAATLATILYVNPVIDPQTRQAEVIAGVDNRNGLWPPGSFIQAAIIADTIPVSVSIPRKAVQQVDGEPVVFVAKEDGFEIRPVTLGRQDKERVEIVDGLSNGEVIAVENSFLLKAEHEKHEAEHAD